MPVDAGIDLYVPDGDGYAMRVGTEVAPGTWRFEGVPQGLALLRSGTVLVASSADEVDLDSHRSGRADVTAFGTSNEAPVSLVLDGLAPWQDPSSLPGPTFAPLQLIAPNVRLAGSVSLSAAPVAGQTSLADESASFRNVFGLAPAVDAEKGDTVWVTQRETRDGGTAADGTVGYYSTVVRAAEVAPHGGDAGVAFALEATLAPVAEKEASFEWRRGAFTALSDAVFPGGTLGDGNLTIRPIPNGLESGWLGYSGDLLVFLTTREAGTTITSTVSYGNPEPSTWGEMMEVWYTVAYTPTSVGLPGYFSPTNGTLSVMDTVAGLTSGPIEPRITPARNFLVDGAPATTERKLSSATPLLTWEPPEHGTPTSYSLRIIRYKFQSESARPSIALTVTLPSSARQLRMPPGALEAGGRYVFVLAAMLQPGTDVERTPLVERLPRAEADTLSALLTAP